MDQLFLPYKFYGGDMLRFYLCIFSSYEPPGPLERI